MTGFFASIIGSGGWTRTIDLGIMSPHRTLKLLNKLPVSYLSELSSLSKSYISQVRNGKRPPSKRLLKILVQLEQQSLKPQIEYFDLFMQSRQMMKCSKGTMRYYRNKLSRFLTEIDPNKANEYHIERFLIQFKNAGNRQAYFRAIRSFYNWRERTYNLKSPMKHMKAPRVGKLIMIALEREQVETLIESIDNNRDKAIIALFTESGLRLTELVDIKMQNINWDRRTIRIIGKGNKEGFAPFGELSERYLKQWLSEYNPNGGNIWGLNKWGITSLLRRLEVKTGIKCNPHTFRRTFACLLRKSGVDTMTIKDLGRWESLEMVQRYTRSITFEDSLKHYKAPLST